MSSLRFKWGWVVGLGAAAVACATATTSIGTNPGSDGGADAAADGSACPGFDLQTDPKHCGSCTTVCTSAQVCSAGVCKNQCDAPTIKCSGGQTCVDVTKDPQNCGACGTICGGPDAGPEGGTGNPEAGIPIPDGGLDAGSGWVLPTSGCASSKCGLSCAGGTSLCSDNICWDTQNAHEHCGSCTTACGGSEWCTKAHCCATGTDWCGSSCINVLTDAKNCGSCGNVCPVNAPTCVSGKCGSQVAVTTVCNKSNPSGILCSGNCSFNDAQYADAYCKLAGYTKAVSYSVLSSGSVNCLYYNTQNVVPTQCSEIIGPFTGYGLNSTCHAIQNLMCQ